MEEEAAYMETIRQERVQEQKEELSEALTEVIGRLSSEERKLCEQLESTKAEEILIKENVARRQNERKEQQAAAEEALVQRELELWRQIKNDLRLQFDHLQERRNRKAAEIKEAERHAMKKECKEIVWGIVRLTELEQEYKTHAGKASVPQHFSQKCRQMFVSSDATLKIFRLETD